MRARSARRESGYRAYGPADIHPLAFAAAVQIKAIALEHVNELRRRARDLNEMAEALKHLAPTCEGDHRPECPIIKGLEGQIPFEPQCTQDATRRRKDLLLGCVRTEGKLAHRCPPMTAIYLRLAAIFLALNGALEFLQLPLYTILWSEPWSRIAFALVHCTAGDLLIGASALVLAVIAGPGWLVNKGARTRVVILRGRRGRLCNLQRVAGSPSSRFPTLVRCALAVHRCPHACLEGRRVRRPRARPTTSVSCCSPRYRVTSQARCRASPAS